jgi:hypothetical protein
MRSHNSRRFQGAMVALTIVCALALGYLTGAIAGGGVGSRSTTPAPLPQIVAQATADTETTITAEPSRTSTPEIRATPTASPTKTAMPTATSTAQPEQPEVFIEDTFDTEANSWPTGATETWAAGYVDQRYQLKLNGQTSIGFTTPIPAENYRLGIDVVVTEGGAGVVFLFAEPATSYRIIISAQGAYAIERQEGNATTKENIVTKIIDWTDHAALRTTAGATNRLTIEREGERIRFTANDQVLTEFAVPPGPFVNRYGFVLTSRTGQGEASFDNLRGERLPGS